MTLQNEIVLLVPTLGPIALMLAAAGWGKADGYTWPIRTFFLLLTVGLLLGVMKSTLIFNHIYPSYDRLLYAWQVAVVVAGLLFITWPPRRRHRTNN